MFVPQSAQPPEVIPAIPEISAAAKSQIYAGFWLRAAAFLIDILIIAFFTGLIAEVHPSAFFRSLDPNIFMQSPFSALTPLGFALFMTSPWLYGAVFESSAWRATPGKRLLGICVTDLHGQRVSFSRALFRNLAKQISGFLLVGYFLAGFTPRKQALHDILASCLIVRTARS